ncbi:MAG TPA: ABC transporter ATP-binding protein [Erysipelotrichaceae bacterium]|nr:ABC transporter ATP-binding protein [Erysipelotrichaceae bacterium]
MKTILEFRNVKKYYQIGEVKIEALKGVNFEIKEGEFVVILGASGAGKSTILNLLGGMDRASEGSIIVEDINIEQYNDKELTTYRRNKVGFVFQFYNLINNLTALENVEFASSIKKDSLNPKEIIEKVGLSHRTDNFPTQLSGGEQQRVAIARAIAKNPLLLLCDEPTGALDDITGRSILTLLDDLNRDFNKTVILITHNAQIAEMADKIIHVRNGLIDSINMVEHPKRVAEIDWQ